MKLDKSVGKEDLKRWKMIEVRRKRKKLFLLTGWPFCCADLDSLKLKTSPPKDVSRHKPHFAVPPQNFPFGCIIRTPFVVSPSISTLSCHFVAFSFFFVNSSSSSSLFLVWKRKMKRKNYYEKDEDKKKGQTIAQTKKGNLRRHK